jgi:hypothetical protein
MLLPIGDYLIQLFEFRIDSEMQRVLQGCKLGCLELEDDLYSGEDDYAIKISSKEGAFGIGIQFGNFSSIRPSLLLDYTQLNLLLGYGQTIIVFDIRSKQILEKHTLGGDIFYQFRSLQHLGIDEFCLVESELAVMALTYQGKQLWKYDAHDIITSIEVTQQQVTLQLWNLASPVHLNLIDGGLIK